MKAYKIEGLSGWKDFSSPIHFFSLGGESQCIEKWMPCLPSVENDRDEQNGLEFVGDVILVILRLCSNQHFNLEVNILR